MNDYLQCTMCKISVSSFDLFLTERSTEDMLEETAEIICGKYVTDDKAVCKGAVTEMGDIIIPVLSQSIFSPDYFCGEFLGYCSTPSFYTFYAEEWVDKLLLTKPEFLKNNDYMNKIYDKIA